MIVRLCVCAYTASSDMLYEYFYHIKHQMLINNVLHSFFYTDVNPEQWLHVCVFS